jgi:hypothetical protein
MWATNHDGAFPTSFEAMASELDSAANLPKSWLDSFELMNVGAASTHWPGAVFARERVARPNPLGGWTRDYLFCNGSVQEARSPDGNFDAWEQDNTTHIPPASQ